MTDSTEDHQPISSPQNGERQDIVAADLDVPQPEQSLAAFLANRFGNRYLYAVNGNAFNEMGAEHVFRTHFSDRLSKPNTLYVIVGTDSGLLVRHIMEAGLPSRSRYIFIEPETLLPAIETVLPVLPSDIVVCSPEKWREQAERFAFNEYTYLNAVMLIRSLAVEDGYLPLYRDAWNIVEPEFDRLRWQYQTQFGTKAFIEKMLDNLAENRQPVYLLRDHFKSRTAVILAGGPSLDDILPWVKDNRSRLFVIAVSRISRRLHQAQLSPDMIVSVDPHDLSFDVSKEALELAADTILVNADHVNPRLLGQWTGRSLYLGQRYPWNTAENVTNLGAAGPTVTNAALNIAIGLGFSEVIFGGLDLCYSREGYTHARGSNEHAAGPQLRIATQTVRTNDGSIAETDNPFHLATRTFANQAELAAKHDCRLINPAPGAAAIEGIEFIPLSALTLPQEPMDDWRRILPADTTASRLAHYRTALQEIRKFTYTVEKIHALAEEALECNAGLFGRNGKVADFKYKIRMDRIEKRFNTEFKEATQLCIVFGMVKFVKIVTPHNDEEWTDTMIEEAGNDYYSAYIAGADQLLTVLHNAEKRLLSRVDEEADGTALSELAAQWKQDKQPGRIGIWTHKHPHRELTGEEQEIASSLASEYRSEIENTDTAHMRRSKEWSQLKGIVSKAYTAWLRQDHDALSRLQRSLHHHPGEEAKPLAALVDGYIAELEGRTDDAITAYQDANQGQALERALLQLVSIALSGMDLENAINGMKALVTISPAYMPRLAHLLHLTGNIHDAIDTYTDYLTRAPDDLATCIRLGLLYRELGITEGAEILFKHVLEKNPQDPVATQLLQEMDGA